MKTLQNSLVLSAEKIVLGYVSSIELKLKNLCFGSYFSLIVCLYFYYLVNKSKLDSVQNKNIIKSIRVHVVYTNRMYITKLSNKKTERFFIKYFEI